jgi:hypothetical protein
MKKLLLTALTLSTLVSANQLCDQKSILDQGMSVTVNKSLKLSSKKLTNIRALKHVVKVNGYVDL